MLERYVDILLPIFLINLPRVILREDVTFIGFPQASIPFECLLWRSSYLFEVAF